MSAAALRPCGQILRTAVAIGGAALLALLWWSTADSTVQARLAAMAPIEPSAMAVYEQIIATHAATGRWAQTVHTGYSDAWNWSGHRSLLLFLTSALYGLSPSTLWLSRIQLGAVLLGAFPAALLGRRALGRPEGLLLGAALYLGAPAVMGLALQDYQDLVFALPAVLLCAAAMRSGRPWAAALGAGALVLPREECLPMVLAVALVCPPWGGRPGPWWRRLRFGAWAVNLLVAVGIIAYAKAWHSALATGSFTAPMNASVSNLIRSDGTLHFEGYYYFGNFYALLLVPVGLVGLLSPLPAAVGALLILLHMTVPTGQGVDRSWTGHCHHLAPLAGFLLVAGVEGAGRLLRALAALPLGRLRPLLIGALCLGGLVYGVEQYALFARQQNLRVSLLPQAPVWTHPIWELVAQVPPGAGLLVSRVDAIAASSRPDGWTFDDSLGEKRPRQGLGVGTYMAVQDKYTCAVAGAMAMSGATVVAAARGYSLIRWDEGAVDPRPSQWIRGNQSCTPSPELGPYRRRSDIPGVAERVTAPRPTWGGPAPEFRMPAWLRALQGPSQPPRMTP